MPAHALGFAALLASSSVLGCHNRPPKHMQPSAQTNAEMTIPGAHSERAWFFFRNSVIFLSWLIGFVICIRLALARSYNYDEISHAHMAWLLSVGEVPYKDFAINHLPFFWVILSPLLRILPPAPVTLVVLRLVALLLNLVFVAALGAMICAKLEPRQRIWGAAVLGLFATNPFVVQYLVELRPDALANALLFVSILWLSSGGSARPVGIVGAGFGIGAALLVNTKYFLFPFILGVAALLYPQRQDARRHQLTFGVCAGFGVAIAVGLLTLAAIHVNFREAWSMVVEYNAAVEKARPFGFGAATALTASPLLLLLSIVGILAYLPALARRKIRIGHYEVAVLVFLLVFLFTTTRPWKQYAVSWFLLAALFPSRIGALLATRFSPRTQFAAAAGILAFTNLGWLHSGFSDPDAAGGVSRGDQDGLIHFCAQHLRAQDYVVAGFPLHPVFWRDSFFKVVIDRRSKGEGDSLEEIMPKLSGPWPCERWDSAGYEKELEERPPSLIVITTLITEAQIQALSAYLKRHGRDYQYRSIPDTAITVLLRRSQAQ